MSSGKRFIAETRPGQFYIRKSGRYYPLKGETGWLQPDTPEFDSMYWAILSGKKTTSKNNFKSSIDLYRKSDRFKEKAPRTKRDYNRVLEYLIERAEKHDFLSIKRKHIIEMMKANEHRTHFANQIPVVVSQIFENLIDLGTVSENPAKGVRRLKQTKQQPHIMWTAEAIAKFRTEASPKAVLAFEIGLGTGQRPADWTKMKWNDIEDGGILVTQNKTKAKLWVPLTAPLRSALGNAPRKGITILTTQYGRAMSYRSLAQMMLKERRRLGVEKHDLHALRINATTELDAAGCDDKTIMAVTGHKTVAMVRHYTHGSRQKALAESAQKLRERNKPET